MTKNNPEELSLDLETNEHPDSALVKVYFDVQETRLEIDLPAHQRFIDYLLQAAGEQEAELSISFISDEAIQQLNQQYRGLDKPTDVLSFSLREGDPVGQIYALGDIVISLDTAQRQAESFGHSLTDEINELLFHGFIHLLGHDHDGVGSQEWQETESSLKNDLKRIGSIIEPKGLNMVNHPDSKGGMTDV
jgi:probable rRNA maturation factor